MMKNILYSLIAILLLMSCKQRVAQTGLNNDSIKVIDIENSLSEIVPSLPLSDAASTVEIIPLETNSNSFIANMKDVAVTEHDIFVSDYKDQRLLRFSHEGKFLNRIGTIGQGPEEYIQMGQFLIDEEKKEVYIVTTLSGINVYEFDGTFKRKATKIIMDDMTLGDCSISLYESTPFICNTLPVLKPNVNSVDSLWSFALADSCFNIKARFYNPSFQGREKEIIEHRARAFEGEWANYWKEQKPSIDFYDGKFTMKYFGVDTLYQFDVDKQVFLPKYSLALDKRPDFEMSHLWIKERKFFDYLWVYDFYDSKDYIYFSVAQSDKIYTLRYDKETGKTEATKKQGEIFEHQFPAFSTPFLRMDTPFSLKNDLCGGGDFTVDYKSLGKYWVSAVVPSDLLEKIDVEALKKESVKDEKAKQQLLHVLDNVTEEDNPVLVIATLK
ncbi:6-bladed beta-propeller [Bacteroides sp.]